MLINIQFICNVLIIINLFFIHYILYLQNSQHKYQFKTNKIFYETLILQQEYQIKINKIVDEILKKGDKNE